MDRYAGWTKWGLCCVAIAALAAGASRRAAGQDVMPLRLPCNASEQLGPVRERAYRVVEGQARYLLSLVHPWQEDERLKLLTESRSTEHWIRPNTGAVSGFCFLYRFGPYDEARVGISRTQLLQQVILPMFGYLVATHRTGDRVTGDGKPWGHHWQSAHWAQMIGRAAWWIWDDLPPPMQSAVRRVVADEADRIAASEIPHQVRGDTKAEENAWNSQILSVAVLLMPHDPRRATWEEQFRRWAFSSFLRPADAQCTALIDGRPVSEQFTGANVFDDFTLENHGFVHPDYMSCFSLSLGCALDYAMTGRKPPEALVWNVAGVDENLKWFLAADGAFVYPNGQDWTIFRHPIWFGKHVLVGAAMNDADAWQLAIKSLEAAEKMQARSPSGAVYDPIEFFFPSTQTDLIYSYAQAWLWLNLVDRLPDNLQPRWGVRRLDQGKILIHRTPAAINTISWGAKCMIQCVPMQADRLVSPDQRSGVGHVRLAGQSKPLPVALHSAEVENGEDWCRARLVIDHGQAVRAELHVRSAGDGALHLEERLTAREDITTEEVATGLVGILNNPKWIYERGRREVTIDGATHQVAALSGRQISSRQARQLHIDSVLEITGSQPLSVAYFTATEPERGRATDRLYLNYHQGLRQWKAGQIISQYEATLRCRPQQTASH